MATAFAVAKTAAVEFAQEPFLVSHGVAAQGSALVLPPLAGSPLDFLDWPAGTSLTSLASLEAGTLPLFDGLSHATLGAAHYRYDEKTLIFAMTGIIGTDDIPIRPLLSGTREERLNRPELRPDECGECGMMNDRVYLGAVNAQRAFRGFLPRSGIASRPIPLTLHTGLTAKYFWEELEGGGYFAQALNADLGASLELSLGYDPVRQSSSRDIRLQFNGFEILPSSQRSEIEGYVKEERSERRWRLGLSWLEVWPELKSKTVLGITKKSEGEKWPGFAAEWGLKQSLFVRAGYDGQTWASGVSMRWHMVVLHYAVQRHPLGITWYQVSIQGEWPNRP